MMNRYLPVLFALLLLVPSGSAFSQDGAPDSHAMQRLAGGFQVLMERTAVSKRAGASPLPLILQKTAIRDEVGVVRYPAIIRTSDPEALQRAGIPVNSVMGSIVTARLTAEEIRTAAGIASIRRIQPAAIASLHNDEAAREVGARILNSGAVNGTSYSGQGVLTCIVDSGLDFDHGDFMDASGDTRVVYLWDQTNTTSGQTPEDRSGTMSGLDYGTEYSASDIDAGTVTQEDTDGHGTHVAGTVASSGNALVLSGSQTTPEHRGMAPEADIIVVKAGDASFAITDVIDAMTYCGQVATDQNQPLVINMSLGSDFGAHDGTATLDLAVDAFTDVTPNDGSNDPGTAPDRVVVVSAGNDGASAQHVTGTIAGGNTASEPWTVGEYSPSDGTANDYVGIQKWFDTAEDVIITVTAPNGTDSATLTGSGTTVDDVSEETPSGLIILESGIGLDNGDRYFDIQIFDYEDTSVDPAAEITPAEGEWQIEIENPGSSAFTYHGWTWGALVPGSFDNGDGDYTIGSPGTSTGAITVGSHAHRWYWGTNGSVYGYASGAFSDRSDISFFSSRGPRRDGVVKPDLTAPGQAMVSAYSQDMPEVDASAIFDQDGMHRYTQGTSMSSPVVAGSVALLLQAAQQEGTSLTANQVRSYLTSNADTDGFTAQYGAVPNAVFGYGKLDILDAVVDFLGGTASREMIADYDDVAFGDMTRLDITSAAPRIAIRFQPTVNGHVSGSLLRLWHDGGSPGGSAIGLTGPLNVEIWSDDGSGAPDAQIGNTVAVPAEQLFPFTPNAFDLQAADVKVTAGTDYHLVLSASNASDALYLSGETASGAGRTTVFDGTGWSQASADLQASIEVARIFGITTSLPVELATFDGRPVDDTVELVWTTLSETNNEGFYVERRPGSANATAAWTTVGFVDGAGTTSESQQYRFTDARLPFGEREISYRLRQVDVDGTPTYSKSETVRLGTPGQVTLHPPFPNPAGRQVTVRYELPADGPVRIAVYDVLGRRVRTVTNGNDTKGRKEVTVSTDRLAPGMYFVRLETGGTIRTQRLSVVR